MQSQWTITVAQVSVHIFKDQAHQVGLILLKMADKNQMTVTCAKCRLIFPRTAYFISRQICEGVKSLVCPVCLSLSIDISMPANCYQSHAAKNETSTEANDVGNVEKLCSTSSSGVAVDSVVSESNDGDPSRSGETNDDVGNVEKLCSTSSAGVAVDSVVSKSSEGDASRSSEANDDVGNGDESETDAQPTPELCAKPCNDPAGNIVTNESKSGENGTYKEVSKMYPEEEKLVKSHGIDSVRQDTHKALKCSFCRRGFMNGGELAHHEKIHTSGNLFHCSFCGRKFTQSEHLIAHRKSHKAGKEPFCSFCGEQFSSSQYVLLHQVLHTGEKPHGCTICGKRFLRKYALMIHERSHTGERPFPCNLCGEAFARKSRLDRHMMVHTGLRPYHCVICGRGFVSTYKLQEHIRIHTGEKPFSCSLCHMKFALKGSAVTHEKRRTCQGMSYELPKKFPCSHCGVGFTSQSKCDNHERIHTGEKPFACFFCCQRFPQKSNLVGHEKIHNGKNLYRCLICKKASKKQYACTVCKYRFNQRADANPVRIHIIKKDDQFVVWRTDLGLTAQFTYHDRLQMLGKTCICDICDRDLSLKMNPIVLVEKLILYDRKDSVHQPALLDSMEVNIDQNFT